MKIGEIFVALGIDSDKFQAGVKAAKKEVALFTAEVTASLYAIDRFVDATTRGAVALANLAAQSGMTAQELQHFGLAATFKNAGISAEEAEQQVAAFSQNLYDLQHFGKGNAEGFQALGFMGRGISFYGKNASQVLDELRVRLKGLNDQAATNVLQKFGFSPAMLTVLRQTKNEFDATAKSIVLTPAQNASLQRTAIAVNQLKLNFAYFAKTMSVELEPVWNKLINFLYLGMRLAHDFTVGIGMLSHEWEGLTGATKDWVKVLGAAFLAYLMPIRAMILGILLLLDDYIAYKSGGKSIIGGLLKDGGKKATNAAREKVGLEPDEQSKDTHERLAKFNKDGMNKLQDEMKNPEKYNGGDPHGAGTMLWDWLHHNSMSDRSGNMGPNLPPHVSGDGSDMSLDDVLKQAQANGSSTFKKTPAQITGPGFYPSLMNQPPPASASKETSFNNTYHITGGDAPAVADAIVDKQQKQFNYANSDQGNGAQY